MKNWKFDLFNFKQALTLEQLEISFVVEKHLQKFELFSEKELTNSLKQTLSPFSYDTDVKRLVESLDEELQTNTLLYNLKDLYKKIERKEYGMLYGESLSKILDVINKDTDTERMSTIVNELAIYDWVPEIKSFIVSLTTDPTEIKNMTSNGAKSNKVYTVVESVEGGHVAYVGNRWFFLGETEVKETSLTEHFKGDDLATLQNLELAMLNSFIENEKINFVIDDNLVLELNTNGTIFINGEEADKETTLENLFNSPIIPMMKKNMYVMVRACMESLDRFVELDVVSKVTNMVKPLSELCVFNYKDKMYLYAIDKRTGSSFYQYESVSQLINDVQREISYDISDFVSNKLSKELKQYKKLENKEQEITGKIKDVQESIEALSAETELLNESVDLKAAFDNLIAYKEELINNLQRVKNAKVAERRKI